MGAAKEAARKDKDQVMLGHPQFCANEVVLAIAIPTSLRSPGAQGRAIVLSALKQMKTSSAQPRFAAWIEAGWQSWCHGSR